MASKQWRIASFSLSICLSGGLGGCLSLTALESSPSMTTVDPAPVADLDDSGVLETPRRRQTGNGVDPIAVLAHRTHDRMGDAAVTTVERCRPLRLRPRRTSRSRKARNGVFRHRAVRSATPRLQSGIVRRRSSFGSLFDPSAKDARIECSAARH